MSGPTKWTFQATFPSGEEIPEQHIKRNPTEGNITNQITTCFVDSFEDISTRLGKILQFGGTLQPEQYGSGKLTFFVGRREEGMYLGPFIRPVEMIPIDSWKLVNLRPIFVNFGCCGEDDVFEITWEYESCVHECIALQSNEQELNNANS